MKRGCVMKMTSLFCIWENLQHLFMRTDLYSWNRLSDNALQVINSNARMMYMRALLIIISPVLSLIKPGASILYS